MKTSPKPVASRGRVLLVLVGALACVGLMMIPALLVAHGETASHTKLHLASSAVVMAVATLIALVWRSTRRRSEAIARSALLVTVSLLAASQLAESAGAYAWEADGTTLRSPTLHVVHTVAALTGAVSLFAVGAAALAAFTTLALRFVRLLRRGAPSPSWGS